MKDWFRLVWRLCELAMIALAGWTLGTMVPARAEDSFSIAQLSGGAGGFPGPGMKAAATPPTVNYVGRATFSSGSGTTTYTFTMPLDNPSYLATRRIIVMSVGNTTGRTLLAAGSSICGQAVDVVDTYSGSAAATDESLASALVTSGTTSCTLTLEFSSSNFSGGVVNVYSVDNSLLSSITPVRGAASVATTSPNSTSVAVLSGGFLLVLSNSPGVNPSSTTGDTALTQDELAFSHYAGHANGLSATAAYNVSTTWTGSSGNALVLWAYR